MRTTAVLLLALLTALAAPAVGQPMTFSEPYQVRAAVGDIPTTTAIEAPGVLNVEQTLKVQFDNGSSEADRTYHFTIPAGSTLANATCDCERATHDDVGTAIAFRIEPQTASGERTIRIVSRQPVADVFGFRLTPPTDGDAAVIVYAPRGMDVAGSLAWTDVGAATNGQSTIHYARFGGAEPFVVVVQPEGEGAVVADPSDGDSMLTAWLLPAALGLVLGILLWATLVSKGLVQAKSRKQVATTAAHVEAAANDPPAVLEGKKRALLAALKEVELAKQANEMPIEVYDAVKADLKKQAVTVMRALESGGEQAKP